MKLQTPSIKYTINNYYIINTDQHYELYKSFF